LLTNNLAFHDRFGRPHIVQLFIPISYLLFVKNETTNKKKYLFTSIVILTFLILSDPWLVCFFLNHYTIFSFFKKQIKNNFYILFTFFSSVMLIFLMVNNHTEEFNFGLNFEYLGFKKIYSSANFTTDYLIEIFIRQSHILILILILSIVSVINRSFILLFSVYCSLLFGWVPYLLIDSTIQAYHIIIAAKSFLIYILIFEIGMIISKCEIKYSPKQFGYLSLIIVPLIVNFHSFKSDIFNRADNLFKNYAPVFNDLDNINENCEIFSNDIYARSYTTAFTKNKLSVPDGFYEPLEYVKVIEKIDRTMTYLKSNYTFKNKREFTKSREKLLHYATHNYFSISNSLIAPSLKETLNEFNQNEFQNTFAPWNLVYPNSFYDNNEFKKDTIHSGLIIIKNDYDYFLESPRVINLCSPSVIDDNSPDN